MPPVCPLCCALFTPYPPHQTLVQLMSFPHPFHTPPMSACVTIVFIPLSMSYPPHWILIHPTSFSIHYLPPHAHILAPLGCRPYYPLIHRNTMRKPEQVDQVPPFLYFTKHCDLIFLILFSLPSPSLPFVTHFPIELWYPTQCCSIQDG